MALRTTDQHASKGVSLARVPALVLGSILLAFGLLAFLTNGDTPTNGFTDGTVQGENLLGFEVSGWTAFFTSVAGGLLLFGAAQHLLAKTMSLLVGLALGACSVIALVDGDDVLGLAAANGPTKLGWGIAAAFLLLNTLLPRKGGKARVADRDHEHQVEHDRTPAVPPRRGGTERQEVTADGTARHEATANGTERRDVAGRQDDERDVVSEDRRDAGAAGSESPTRLSDRG